MMINGNLKTSQKMLDKINTKGNHPNLAGLKALWNIPEETLNKILWANHDWNSKGEDIGRANKYIEFMDAIIETSNPAEAWEQWCIENKIEHEIENNPYIN